MPSDTDTSQSMDDSRGKRLFEDDLYFRNQRPVLIFVVAIFFFLSIMLLVSQPPLKGGNPNDHSFGIIAGFIVLGIGSIFLYVTLTMHKFTIYKNGLQFTFGKFVPFSSVLYATRERADLIRISVRGDLSPVGRPVCPGIRKGAEGVGDWTAFCTIFLQRLRETHPGINDNWLFRDYLNVRWLPEAEAMLGETGSWNRQMIFTQANNSVLEQGRNVVYPEDVQRFLR